MAGDKDDMSVIMACLEGNSEQFAHIFNKYRERIYSLALGLVRERALAKDVTQNSFINAFRSLEWFDRRSRFSTWLYRIAYNQAMDELRKKKRRGEVKMDDQGRDEKHGSQKDELFQSIARGELCVKVLTALNSLPVKLRSVAAFRYIEGLSYSEICSIVGCARGVLQKRLKRANEKLRGILKHELSELRGDTEW